MTRKTPPREGAQESRAPVSRRGVPPREEAGEEALEAHHRRAPGSGRKQPKQPRRARRTPGAPTGGRATRGMRLPAAAGRGLTRSGRGPHPERPVRSLTGQSPMREGTGPAGPRETGPGRGRRRPLSRRDREPRSLSAARATVRGGNRRTARRNLPAGGTAELEAAGPAPKQGGDLERTGPAGKQAKPPPVGRGTSQAGVAATEEPADAPLRTRRRRSAGVERHRHAAARPEDGRGAASGSSSSGVREHSDP